MLLGQNGSGYQNRRLLSVENALDGEPRTARLSKLGGADWGKQKSRAKAAAKDLAKGLIALFREDGQIQLGILRPGGESPYRQMNLSAFGHGLAGKIQRGGNIARVSERVKNVLWQAREDTESLLAAGEKGPHTRSAAWR